MAEEVEFQIEPNTWINYEDAPSGLQSLMDDMSAASEKVQNAVDKGKHYYQARKCSDFLIVVAYDDVTHKPTKCIIDPAHTH